MGHGAKVTEIIGVRTGADLGDNGTMPDNKRGILAVIRGIREWIPKELGEDETDK